MSKRAGAKAILWKTVQDLQFLSWKSSYKHDNVTASGNKQGYNALGLEETAVLILKCSEKVFPIFSCFFYHVEI